MTFDTEGAKEELEELQNDIHEAREHLGDELGENQRTFIERGEMEPVDDTIVPPG